MKNVFLIIFILSLFLISACVKPESPVGKGSDISSGMPVPAVNSNDVEEKIVVEEEKTTSKNEVKQFEVIAKQFEFIPNTIEVYQGDKVKLLVTSTDVTHGFAINEYEINERIAKGDTAVIEFTADKKGTFTFYCSVSCGSGHGRMKGTLIVR